MAEAGEIAYNPARPMDGGRVRVRKRVRSQNRTIIKTKGARNARRGRRRVITNNHMGLEGTRQNAISALYDLSGTVEL